MVFCFAISLAACGGGSDESQPILTNQSKPGVLSISAMPRLNPFPTTPTQYATVLNEAFDLAFAAGARGQVTTFTWAALEPAVNQYDAQKFQDLTYAIDNAQSHAMTQYVGIQLINTTVRELPAELSALAFDNAAVMAQFRLLLDRILTPSNRGRIKYLSIGNEVDAYLRAHPSEWQPYRNFYAAMATYARSLDPAIQVGVTGTAEGALIDSPVELAQLNASSDVVILTYYPISTTIQGATVTVTADSPSVVASDVPMMLNFAGAKPLVLQEVGYPAASLNQSSEQMQAQFVSNVFSSWRTANGRIPFLNFFLLHDFTAQMCVDFGSYYGLPNIASFESFLCSLGLRRDDGTPRAAWARLQSEATQIGLP
jgi:hypothetical protein